MSFVVCALEFKAFDNALVVESGQHPDPKNDGETAHNGQDVKRDPAEKVFV
jgi:hypothetical protein